MSLANKYRPRTFDTIIWQDHVTNILKAKIKNDKGGNSNFLFFWPRWTGKTSSARILAKAINCLNTTDGNPCNECLNCKTINEWTTLDYIEIDAASHTWVDNIREEILDKVPYPPTVLKKKIYVIDEVHMLSKGAFNALLKTIEEPKDTMSFILATTEVHKVPETIVSRCQVFNFKKVHSWEMVQRLEEIAKKEELPYSAVALEIIAKLSEWCVRDAVKYLDQVSILWDISEEHVIKFLWVASESSIQWFLANIKKWDREAVFVTIDELYTQWVDLQNFAKQVLMYIDTHIADDTDFLLHISEFFTEILGTIRYYPYPAIVYKIVINKALGNHHETAHHQTHHVAQQPVHHQVKHEEKTIQATKSEPESHQAKPHTEHHHTWNTWDNQKLLDELLARVDKASLQKSLKEHLIIDKVDWDIVNIVVINKFTQVALEKAENKTYLEWILSDILGKKVGIHIRFQNKDEYFENLQNSML